MSPEKGWLKAIYCVFHPHGVAKNNQGKVGNFPKSTRAGVAKGEGALDLILYPRLQEWKQTEADDAL